MQNSNYNIVDNFFQENINGVEELISVVYYCDQ